MTGRNETGRLWRYGLGAPRMALLENRNVILSGAIDDSAAARMVEELLFLDFEQPGMPITFNVVDSPGGSVTAGYAILDTARRVKAPVSTVGCGMVASMAAILLVCAGDRGRRYATQNCSILLHQPMGMARGQATDVEIAADNLKQTRRRLEELVAEASGLPLERVHGLCERDTHLTAQEALELGLIDRIVEAR